MGCPMKWEMMDKDINCLNFKGLFGYIENRFGKQALHKLVEDAINTNTYLISNKSRPGILEPVTREHLMDESYWISNELSLSLLSMIKTVVPGPNPEQTAGQGAVLENLSKRDLFFSKLLGPKALARRAARVNAKFNRTKDVLVSHLEDNAATIALHYKPGFKVTKDVCNWNLGIYRGLAKASGARSIQADEVKCILEGDGHCEFRLAWQIPSLFNRTYTAVLKVFTKELIDAYEKTVNDRDRLIEELCASEYQYRLLIENQSDMVVKMDTQLKFQFVSPSYAKMFGETQGPFLGKPFMTHVHEEDREVTARMIAALYHPPYRGPIEHRAMTKKGCKWFSWMARAVLDDNKTVLAITGVGRDITEKKQIEDSLKESEALFKLITAHTSALVSIHDSDGNYIFASPSHERLGVNPDALIGQSGFTLLEADDVVMLLAQLEKARKGEISKAYLNYTLRDKDNQIHYYQGAFDGVFNPDGSLEKIVCVGEDITELRKVQAEKMEALAEAAESKKLALVGEIAGKMAHDFNNILGIIMGTAELSLIDCKDAEAGRAFDLIFGQTIRGKTLTKNLVAFAKDQELKQDYFSINQKIELVLSLLKKDLQGINIIRRYGQDIPEILADPGMIEHMLVNIIQNSIHATSLVEQPEIRLKTTCRDAQVCIEIEDNGCGVPQKFLGKIFDPSFTLKGRDDTTGSYKPGIKGTGYGLANVKKYVEQHQGSLSISSDVKKGTQVTISLPVIKNKPADDIILSNTKEKSSHGKRILLVEDEPEISDVQYKILTQEPCNHQVDIVGDGQGAIACFGKNEYDVVSLDYILQGQLNGMDVYDHIRAANKKIPILFISGNIEFLESINKLKQKDAYIDHLSKPCQKKDYVDSMQKLLVRCQAELQ